VDVEALDSIVNDLSPKAEPAAIPSRHSRASASRRTKLAISSMTGTAGRRTLRHVLEQWRWTIKLLANALMISTSFSACDRRHNRTITTTDALINADKFASSVLPGQAVLTLRLRLG
jgi:hypothetical protein